MEGEMSKYIVLMDWTGQGIANVKDAAKRLDAGKASAKSFGGKIEAFYLTMGGHDGVLVVEMPSDDSMAKFLLSTGQQGNIRTTTLQAFDESDYRKIIGSLGKTGGKSKVGGKKKKKKKR
jgi:uncharacterized protein with GYD domain